MRVKPSGPVAAILAGMLLLPLLPGLSGCALESRAINAMLDTLGLGGAYPLPESAARELDRFNLAYSDYAGETDHKQLKHFSDTFRRIRANYVEPLDDAALIDAAILGLRDLDDSLAPFSSQELVEAGLDGMLASLDPHSGYLNPREFQESQISTKGQFGGLGIEITQVDGNVQVVSPIEDTPAAAAGLQAGDLITHVNGEDIRGRGVSYAVSLLRGEPGSRVTIIIEREGSEPLPVTITRAIIKVRSVRWHLEGTLGYIRVTRFTERVEPGIVAAMNDIRAQLGSRLKGIVLDLRNNPGGLLDQARILSDAFLDSGVIVSIKSRAGDGVDESRHSASPGDIAEGLPIVVLMNGGSASAAEIVAGSLQDHGRAVVMGTRSFGKGSVQTIMPLPVEGALRLTTARYYAPSGRVIQTHGILPDIVLSSDTEDDQNFEREASLPGALDDAAPLPEKEAPVIDIETCGDGEVADDPALNCAVAFLQSGSTTAFLKSVGATPES